MPRPHPKLAHIQARRAEGASYATIAAEIGISSGRVWTLVNTDLKRRPAYFGRILLAELEAMFAAGSPTMEEIAQRAGMSYAAVTRRRREWKARNATPA